MSAHPHHPIGGAPTLPDPGTAAPATDPAIGPTIVHRFVDQVARHGDRVALRHRTHAGWATLTWREYGEAVTEVATGLAGLGIGPGDRVAILSDNRPEWHITDVAVLALGAVTVPLYQTSAPAQVVHALNDSGATVIVVDGEVQLAKVTGVRSQTPELRTVVALDAAGDDGRALTWWELRELGRDPARSTLAQRAARLAPSAAATIVYTSGTTGAPKGAVLTHANIAFTASAVTAVVTVGPDDRFVSFLPLSHIAERIVSHFGQITAGGETWFARSLATVAEDIHDCHPTVFFAVPRIWQKLHEAIVAQVAHQTGAHGMVARTYLGLAAAGGSGLRWRLLDRVVGRIVRTRLGLDRARVLASGAAPIDPALLAWFAGIGLPICEVYGQTEDCGPATMNPPGAIRIGTVGRPLPGVEVRIAADGEVLVRGGSVCAGYWCNAPATAELIDGDHWMHTGDIGMLDELGYLRITGRKKDLIITAAGHNVAPQPIELELQAEPLIGHAVVVGDGRPYLTALVTLDETQMTEWADRHHRLREPQALVNDPDVLRTVDEGVARVNARRARAEGVKRVRVLPHPLTVDAGELTPTMKVRRAAVMARYADLVDELYAGS